MTMTHIDQIEEALREARTAIEEFGMLREGIQGAFAALDKADALLPSLRASLPSLSVTELTTEQGVTFSKYDGVKESVGLAGLSGEEVVGEAFAVAFLKASGEWVVPYRAPRESGVAVDGDITEEDAAFFNREAAERFMEFAAQAHATITKDTPK